MMQPRHMTDDDLIQEGLISDNPLAYHLAQLIDRLPSMEEYEQLTDELEELQDEKDALEKELAEAQNPFDQYEYCVGSHFLSSLFNGDDSGLEDDEIKQLARFCANAETGSGHWSGGDEEDYEGFAECDVTGLMGDCHRLIWNQRKK